MNVTDEHIAGMVQAGDKNAFGQIIDRFEQPLCAFIRRILADRDNCEDALQETFIKAYKNINAFDTRRKFSSWVYRIAHNEAVSFYRKHKGRVSLDDIPEIVEETDHAAEVHKKISHEGQKILIEKVLRTLPLHYREVIVLRFYEEKSYEEISEIMHVPVRTVGTYLNRAKKDLKKYFGNSGIKEIV